MKSLLEKEGDLHSQKEFHRKHRRNSWKSVGGMHRKQREELLESIWVVRICGKHVGNWESTGEFPRKH